VCVGVCKQALVGKLDALTHFHFAPKPVVEDLNVRSDVAAVVSAPFVNYSLLSKQHTAQAS